MAKINIVKLWFKNGWYEIPFDHIKEKDVFIIYPEEEEKMVHVPCIALEDAIIKDGNDYYSVNCDIINKQENKDE